MKIDTLSRIADNVKRYYENEPRKVESIEKTKKHEIKTLFEETLSSEDKLMFLEELHEMVIAEQYKEGYAKQRYELREELIALWKTR